MSEQLDDQLIYGIRPIEEALESEVVLDRVFIAQESRNPAIMAIAAKARKKGIFVKFVPAERMQRFTRANHQGVVSWASSVAYADLADVMAGLAERGVDPLVVVLDRVTDVRNVGAIARSCESFGAHTIVLSEGSAPHERRRRKIVCRSTFAHAHLPRPLTSHRANLTRNERLPDRRNL